MCNGTFNTENANSLGPIFSVNSTTTHCNQTSLNVEKKKINKKSVSLASNADCIPSEGDGFPSSESEEQDRDITEEDCTDITLSGVHDHGNSQPDASMADSMAGSLPGSMADEVNLQVPHKSVCGRGLSQLKYDTQGASPLQLSISPLISSQDETQNGIQTRHSHNAFSCDP